MEDEVDVTVVKAGGGSAGPDEAGTEAGETEAGDQKGRQRQRPPPPPPGKKECNSRIDELSKPKRWNLLGTWREFACYFEPARMQMVKEKVQELFSMSPEEAELYFNSLRLKKHPKSKMDLKMLKRQIRLQKMEARNEAFEIFRKIFKKAMIYAYKHAPPLLVTPMLRIVSDHVLEFLCELHQVCVPSRAATDYLSKFLMACADWTAIFVTSMYFEIEVEERRDTERLTQLLLKPGMSKARIPGKEIIIDKYDMDSDVRLSNFKDAPQSTPLGSDTDVKAERGEAEAEEHAEAIKTEKDTMDEQTTLPVDELEPEG